MSAAANGAANAAILPRQQGYWMTGTFDVTLGAYGTTTVAVDVTAAALETALEVQRRGWARRRVVNTLTMASLCCRRRWTRRQPWVI